MSAAQEELLEDKVFRDLNWVAYNGGFVHSNNGSLTLKLSSFVVDINSYPVLFYFAESPFFDRTSNNSSIFGQALGDVRFQSFLATRKNFEGRLRQLSGLEYVVVYDPLELNVQIDGPNGKEISNIWVIAKQNRQKRMGIDDQVIVLAYYYIVGDSIYQAPSVAKVLTNRLVRGYANTKYCRLTFTVVIRDVFDADALYCCTTADFHSITWQHILSSRPDATESSSIEPFAAK